MTRVAVYGTLKRGYGANRMLDSATFVGNGHTVEPYSMVNVGFPKIKPDSDGHPVRVEVYDEPNFGVLDRYEGVPSLYTRRVVSVKLDDGTLIDSFIYEAGEMSGQPVAPVDGILTWEHGGRYGN